jgi:hypothetical protein
MITLPWNGSITMEWQHYHGMAALPWNGSITMEWQHYHEMTVNYQDKMFCNIGPRSILDK